jgi:hypothetical protein
MDSADHVVGTDRIQHIESVVGAGNFDIQNRTGGHGPQRVHKLMCLGGGDNRVGFTMDDHERRSSTVNLIEG